jgi:hypothetical protein
MTQPFRAADVASCKHGKCLSLLAISPGDTQKASRIISARLTVPLCLYGVLYEVPLSHTSGIFPPHALHVLDADFWRRSGMHPCSSSRLGHSREGILAGEANVGTRLE